MPPTARRWLANVIAAALPPPTSDRDYRRPCRAADCIFATAASHLEIFGLELFDAFTPDGNQAGPNQE